MKRRLILCQSLFLLAGTVAHATPIASTSFTETVVYGTDTFETSGGAVLSTIQYGFWSDEIPSDIANDIATDTGFAASDPPAQSFLQSTATEAALTDDLTFLSSQLPDVFYTSTGPTVYTGMFSLVRPEPLEFGTLFPGYSVVSYDSTSLGIQQYETGAIEPSGTLLEGTVNFDVYELDYIEQPSTATPEPSSLWLIGCGLAAFTYRSIVR